MTRISSQHDVDGAEGRALAALFKFDGKRVLEIGAGDGRLTLGYAPRAASVVAIDPLMYTELAPRVRFLIGCVEHIDLPQASFDVALFSRSL